MTDATGTNAAELDPVLHAPPSPLWKVTFGEREWSFSTQDEARAFAFGLSVGRTLVELEATR